MKKFKKISYIILIAVIAVLSFIIYSNATKDNNSENKTITQLKYFESKFVELLNSMNNIQTRNYGIAVGEITKEKEKKSNNQSSSSGESSGGGSSSSQGSGSDSGGGGSSR